VMTAPNSTPGTRSVRRSTLSALPSSLHDAKSVAPARSRVATVAHLTHFAHIRGGIVVRNVGATPALHAARGTKALLTVFTTPPNCTATARERIRLVAHARTHHAIALRRACVSPVASSERAP